MRSIAQELLQRPKERGRLRNRRIGFPMNHAGQTKLFAVNGKEKVPLPACMKFVATYKTNSGSILPPVSKVMVLILIPVNLVKATRFES
jgi:hypothetical protein